MTACLSRGSFLKVSVEELIIALRDDRHLLNDPGGLLAGNYGLDGAHESDAASPAGACTPDDLSAERFVEVIGNGAVWDLQAATRGPTLRSTDREDVACRK